MYKALHNSTYRRGPRKHTHTQKKMDPVGLHSVEPGRGTFPPRAVTPTPNHHGGTRTHDPKSTAHERDQATTTADGANHHQDCRRSAIATKTAYAKQSPRSLLYSPEVGAVSFLATRLLIGRFHRAIRWPSLIEQAHSRRGNSHLSGAQSDLRRWRLRPRLQPKTRGQW